ncbi:MAG: DUF2877 domain-containing protein [Candidatus Eremiobacterota bacterium]
MDYKPEYMSINALSVDKKLMDLLMSDNIECTVYSVFRRAINLETFRGGLISINTRYNGPDTIVLSDRYNLSETGSEPGCPVICCDSGIYIQRSPFINFHNISLWEHKSHDINIVNLKRNVIYVLSFFSNQNSYEAEEIIKKIFLSVQSPSAALLLYDSVISLIKGIKDNHRGRIKSSLSRIIGTGEGLTPAGDDFLTGLLGALYYFIRTLDTADKASVILHIMKEDLNLEKTNFISSRFLSFSLEGRFSQTVLEFLDVLFSTSPVDEKPLKNLLSYGASSGTVTVIGILTGCLLLT